MYILDEEWDILILLDACRYDYFKNMYNKYFDGDLKKVASIGTSTQMWHQKNFHDRNCSNICYITPIVNFDRWCNNYNFYKVIMSWETHWNKEYGTVMAKDTTNIALEHLKVENNKKFIIHYMQPHVPYIKHKPQRHYDRPTTKSLYMTNQSTTFKIRYYISEKLTKYKIPNIWLWYVTNIVNKNSYLADIYFNNNGWDGIRKAYSDNLEHVLNNVKKITDIYSDKKIVITSDHGERLGEGGLVGHCHKRRDNVITEIPWFEVL